MNRFDSKLPEGYRWDNSGAQHAEVYDLFRGAELYDGPELPEATQADIEEMWQEMMFDLLVILAVRAKHRQLAAVSTLNGWEGAPHLSYMAVAPEHRHQGIGKALVNRSIEIAQNMGATTVITGLRDTNTLKPFFLELGFRQTNPGNWEDLRLEL